LFLGLTLVANFKTVVLVIAHRYHDLVLLYPSSLSERSGISCLVPSMVIHS